MLRPSVRYLILLGFAIVVRSNAAFTAELQYPISVAVTEGGTIYLADRKLPGVFKLENGKLEVLFQGSRNFRTPLNAIRCVSVDRDGRLLAGDSATRDIYRFDDSAKPVGLTQKSNGETSNSEKKDSAPQTPDEKKEGAESPDKKDDAEPKDSRKAETPTRPNFVFGQIGIPMDIAVNKAGDMFVSDLEIHRIVKVASNGGAAQEFVQIAAPRGLCLDAEENLWVISGRRLVKVSQAGEKTIVVEDGTFNFPHTVAVAADQTAYVCDGYEKCIWKVPAGGKPEKLVTGEPLINPVGMRLVADKLYVVDPRARAVFQVSLDGKLSTVPLK